MSAKLSPAVGLCAFLVVVTTFRPASAQTPLSTTPPTTAKAAPTLEVRRGWQSESAEFDVSDSESTNTPGAATVDTASTGKRVSAPASVTYFAFDTLPDGSACIRLRRGSPSDALVAAIKMDTHAIMAGLADPGYQRCPSGAGPETTPALEAVSFWRVTGEDMLPKPSPRIAPGYMLAGKLAYLEAGSQPTARFEHPTPLGTLVIEATSLLFVDWGDGPGLDGPHVGPGGPWPDGNVTHFWTTTDRYDIRVIQRWTARWTLAGATGTLQGLETQGLIDDFEVRQLQAVRNR